MKVVGIIICLVMATTVSSALAVGDGDDIEQAAVPQWIKDSAGWWADGAISDGEFISSIEFLLENGIITVSSVSPGDVDDTGDDAAGFIPSWIKSNAGWWADGVISDTEFLNGIGYMIKFGIITVSSGTESDAFDGNDTSAASYADDSVLDALEAELAACSEIAVAYKRSDCESLVEDEILVHNYKTYGQQFVVGPITYHWFGIGSDGNEFEITPTGQPILSIRMLAENTGSEITALHCTSPSICSYDVWDGTKAFKYSGMDFTSGTLTLKPAVAKEFNILFGPNVGYGGTEFEYDSSKIYHFRINESFGSTDILLNLE